MTSEAVSKDKITIYGFLHYLYSQILFVDGHVLQKLFMHDAVYGAVYKKDRKEPATPVLKLSLNGKLKATIHLTKKENF